MSIENIVPQDDGRNGINGGYQEITKVYYYVDDDETPYVSQLATDYDAATLGHFKKAFGRNAAFFRFWNKYMDNDLKREVKVELKEDESKLARADNGLVELYLISDGGAGGSGTLQRKTTGGGGGGTLPRERRVGRERPLQQQQRQDDDVRTRRSYSGHGGSSQDGADDAASTSRPGTLVSRRAGEGLADYYTSASEHPYRYEDSRLSYISAMDAGTNGTAEATRRRKPRKERYRKGYVPSTIGSQPESSGTSMSLPRILEIKLHLTKADILGISVVSVEGSILISDVVPGGAVDRDGRIGVGDQIVQVNANSFENLSDSQAIGVLRKVAAAKKPLTLFVAKRCNTSESADPLSALASETMPLDISMWVENAIHCQQRRRFEVDDESTLADHRLRDTCASPCSEDDEEERILYAERRNGAPRRILEEVERRRREEFLPSHGGRDSAGIPGPPPSDIIYMERLHTSMGPQMLLASMSRPDSGLSVKNRKWLKIPVPQSFIGEELVDWLQQNVDDLHERKKARIYAASLLKEGLIRHVVSKKDFTEKCYYVFEDSVMGSRRTLTTGGGESTQNSGGVNGASEVTYGSPTTIARGTAHDRTWPFSPITVVHKNGGAAGRRADCESKYAESDYASMVGGTEGKANMGRIGGAPGALLLTTRERGGGSASGGAGPSGPPPPRHYPPPNTPLSAGSAINDTV